MASTSSVAGSIRTTTAESPAGDQLRRTYDLETVHLAPTLTGPEDLTRRIGTSLLTRFVLPFELLAVLLLVGLLAASYFARPEE